MSAKTYNELEHMLCDELDEIVSTGKITAGDLDAVHKLTDTIKNIRKIEMLEEEGYSHGGDWTATGRYSRGNDGGYGNSYGRSRHYVRGHYSYDGDGKMMMMDKLEEMMGESDISSEDKRTLRKAMEVLRR